jgi:hypothetical protein
MLRQRTFARMLRASYGHSSSRSDLYLWHLLGEGSTTSCRDVYSRPSGPSQSGTVCPGLSVDTQIISRERLAEFEQRSRLSDGIIAYSQPS